MRLLHLICVGTLLFSAEFASAQGPAHESEACYVDRLAAEKAGEQARDNINALKKTAVGGAAGLGCTGLLAWAAVDFGATAVICAFTAVLVGSVTPAESAKAFKAAYVKARDPACMTTGEMSKLQ